MIPLRVSPGTEITSRGPSLRVFPEPQFLGALHPSWCVVARPSPLALWPLTVLVSHNHIFPSLSLHPSACHGDRPGALISKHYTLDPTHNRCRAGWGQVLVFSGWGIVRWQSPPPASSSGLFIHLLNSSLQHWTHRGGRRGAAGAGLRNIAELEPKKTTEVHSLSNRREREP